MTQIGKPLHPVFILISVIAALLTLLQLFHNSAAALTFTVMNNNDSGAGSLREAIDNAALNPGSDQIEFDAGLDGQTITLSSGSLIITSELAIDATNLPNSIHISGNDTYRVLFIDFNAIVTLTNLSIISGTTQFGSGSCINYCGGAIYAELDSRVTILNSNIGSSIGNSGGGIYNDGDMIISGTVVSGNHAVFDGGGIRNDGRMSITNSSIISNVTNMTFGGAGINTGLFSQLTLDNSTVAYNQANGNGGGIYGANADSLNINQSTLAYNSATGNGGGIYLESNEILTTTATVVNSTLSGNTADSEGGAIYNIASFTTTIQMTLTQSTLYENTAVSVGGIYQTADGTSTAVSLIQNSIIAGSSGNNCSGDIGGDSYNLSDDASCTGFRQGDPRLAPLTNNGGATETHALMVGSTAVTLGNPTICQAAPINGLDQRGSARPMSVCDTGAFEADDGYKLYLPLVLKN